MNKYVEDKTQEGRILKLLKERGEQGVLACELTNTGFMRDRGGAIMQYNSRIWGLRQKGYPIKNVVPGHFVLKRIEPEQSVMFENTNENNILTR